MTHKLSINILALVIAALVLADVVITACSEIQPTMPVPTIEDTAIVQPTEQPTATAQATAVPALTTTSLVPTPSATATSEPESTAAPEVTPTPESTPGVEPTVEVTPLGAELRGYAQFNRVMRIRRCASYTDGTCKMDNFECQVNVLGDDDKLHTRLTNCWTDPALIYAIDAIVAGAESADDRWFCLWRDPRSGRCRYYIAWLIHDWIDPLTGTVPWISADFWDRTETPTDPLDTPTPAPPTPEYGVNLFKNPGFEGDYRAVVFGEIAVAQSWEPFYADKPYTPEEWPALPFCAPGLGFTTSCNPEGTMLGRPEFKPAVDIPPLRGPLRVHSGNSAQQWFGFSRAYDAGVYQVVDTVPATIYRVTAHVQSWSSSTEWGWRLTEANRCEQNSDLYTSQLCTVDDFLSSQWMIGYDSWGQTYAFNPTVHWGPVQLVTEGTGHYDQYVPISFEFVATGWKTTIFIRNRRLWPLTHNDSYLDDVSIEAIPSDESRIEG